MKRPRTQNNDEPKRGKKLDPIIEGLFARLPSSGSEWSEADRKVWLNLIEAAFKVVYEPETPPKPKTLGVPPP